MNRSLDFSKSFLFEPKIEIMSSLASFLESHHLGCLLPGLAEVGVVCLDDLLFLTDQIVEHVCKAINLRVVQRIKFQSLIDEQRKTHDLAEQTNATRRKQQLYEMRHDALKDLVSSQKITMEEFNAWRRQEFVKIFTGDVGHNEKPSITPMSVSTMNDNEEKGGDDVVIICAQKYSYSPFAFDIM